MMNIFKKKKKLPERNLDNMKQISRLLFIDDKKFAVVDILIRAGWLNTQSIKDVESLDQPEIKDAHIIFVDIQGVGKKLHFQDEGLGLTIALKERYPNKKIIVYSSEDQGRVQAFHKGIDIADARLSKSADPYQFQSIVERFSKDILSLDSCVERIQKTIYNEFGQTMQTEEIIEKITKIYNQNDFSIKNVSKIFNLSNAGSIASIVQFFIAP